MGWGEAPVSEQGYKTRTRLDICPFIYHVAKRYGVWAEWVTVGIDTDTFVDTK